MDPENESTHVIRSIAAVLSPKNSRFCRILILSSGMYLGLYKGSIFKDSDLI